MGIISSKITLYRNKMRFINWIKHSYSYKTDLCVFNDTYEQFNLIDDNIINYKDDHLRWIYVVASIDKNTKFDILISPIYYNYFGFALSIAEVKYDYKKISNWNRALKQSIIYYSI